MPYHHRMLLTGLAAGVALSGALAVTPAAQAQTKPAAATSTAPARKPFVKPTDVELRKKLTPIQYSVTQHDATERPYNNIYWDHHEAGIYVDIVSGEPLFSSLDKYDSGTGWPSFTRPLESSNIRRKTDRILGYSRTEIRSAQADSHLGHLFDDGPRPAGLRYCMNSAALRFIPVARLNVEGYAPYLPLFATKPSSPDKPGR